MPDFDPGTRIRCRDGRLATVAHWHLSGTLLLDFDDGSHGSAMEYDVEVPGFRVDCGVMGKGTVTDFPGGDWLEIKLDNGALTNLKYDGVRVMRGMEVLDD